jgi:hypothetical protein
MEATMRTMVLLALTVLLAGCATFRQEYIDGDGQRRVEWRCPPWWCPGSYNLEEQQAVNDFSRALGQGFRGHGPLK